jgi:opacity protein-like surface antigen
MNKLKKKLLASILAGLFISAESFATESIPDKSWTGLKLGLGVGASIGNVKTQGIAGHSLGSSTGGFSDDIFDNFDGNTNLNQKEYIPKVVGSIDAAYDYQLNNKLVFGLIADYKNGKANKFQTKDTGFSGSTYSDDGTITGNSTLTSNISTKQSFSAGLRLGRIIEKDYLPYVAAGFTTIKYNQSATYTAHTGGSSSYDFSSTSSNSGYKAGHFFAAGIETKLRDNASIRIEYRYSDYGKIHLNQNNDNLSVNTGNISPMSGSSYLNVDSHLTQQTITAVLSYDF